MIVYSKKLKLLSSLEKVFFAFPEAAPETQCGSMLKNERHCFQLAIWLDVDENSLFSARIEIESALKPFITAYSVGYVPTMHPVNPLWKDEDYLSYSPGLFPDPLERITDGCFHISCGQTLVLWFAVETDGTVIGTHPITLKVYDRDGGYVDQKTYTLKIIDALLPPQKLLNTGWFHGDSIAILHDAPIGTEKYREILVKYLEVYGKFGHNTILTPVFTPPLDTEIGGERPTNQLVDVAVCAGEYSFGFEKLDAWIDLCQKYGITHFEIAHLFTQWGAYHAPKIMATVDGEYKRIFGWETDALSPEYKAFLDAFLPQLRTFLEKKGVYGHCFFHVSDEPSEKHTEQYRSCREIVAAHIDPHLMMDALSDYVFYEKGLVSQPVASNDHIDPFLTHQVDHLWTYYCCAQGTDVANRFMAMPSYRNRILGWQLYKYNIEGFLQWGFNFWFGAKSKRVLDPYKLYEGNDIFPAGDPYLVYPLNEWGEVVPSLRLFVFAEGLQDLRALELLETLTGRENVLALLADIEGFRQYPRRAEYILSLRQRVNEMIEKMNPRM